MTALAACGNAQQGNSARNTSAPAGNLIAVANGDFEQTSPDGDVPGWMTLQHAGIHAYEMAIEPGGAYSGNGGFRMTRTHPQEYGTLAQDIELPQRFNGDIELSAMLKSRDAGPEGWRLMVIAGAPPVYSTPLTGTTEWQHATVRVKPAPGTTSVRIGITLLDAGTGWADDVQLKAIAP
jgi:hypothetical protein